MARISSFLICDTITNIVTPQGESVPQLISPQPALRPSFIPSSFSFGLSIGVTDVAFQKNNIIRMIITTPDDEETYNSGDINIGTVSEDDYLPKEYQGFVLSIDIRNLVLKQEGIYKAEIIVNEESIGKKDIPVFRKGENK